MMLFHLIRKDILIVKKYVLIMLVTAIAIPPFMLWRAPEYTGILGFILSIIFSVFMLLQYVSLKEYQFPKAATLLCSTPFSRKMMVLSKYIFCIAMYITCCLIFGIETLFIPGLGSFNTKLCVLMFLVVSVFIGIYLPVQYKFGYEKTKFAFVVVIMASPFIFPQLLKMDNLNLDVFSKTSPFVVYGSIVAFGFLVLVVSALLSVKIYYDEDLA